MLKAAKTRAPGSFQVDLRRIGLGFGSALLAISLLMIVTLYALALSHHGWKVTPIWTLTSSLAVALLASSFIILAVTCAVRAVADSIYSYQAGMRVIVEQLAKAIPPAETALPDGVYDIRSGRSRSPRRRMHTMS